MKEQDARSDDLGVLCPREVGVCPPTPPRRPSQPKPPPEQSAGGSLQGRQVRALGGAPVSKIKTRFCLPDTHLRRIPEPQLPTWGRAPGIVSPTQGHGGGALRRAPRGRELGRGPVLTYTLRCQPAAGRALCASPWGRGGGRGAPGALPEPAGPPAARPQGRRRLSPPRASALAGPAPPAPTPPGLCFPGDTCGPASLRLPHSAGQGLWLHSRRAL